MRRTACARATDLRDGIFSIKRERGKQITRSISSGVQINSKFHFRCQRAATSYLRSKANCYNQVTENWEDKEHQVGKWKSTTKGNCLTWWWRHVVPKWNCRCWKSQNLKQHTKTLYCFRESNLLCTPSDVLFRPALLPLPNGEEGANHPQSAWAQEFFRHTRDLAGSPRLI